MDRAVDERRRERDKRKRKKETQKEIRNANLERKLDDALPSLANPESQPEEQKDLFLEVLKPINRKRAGNSFVVSLKQISL